MTGRKIPQLMLALDTDGPESTLETAKKVIGLVPVVKVGPVVLSLDKKDLVGALKDMGFQVFVDVKLHDIPNTVEHAVRGWEKRGADFLTVHASGGRKMLEAAAGASRSVKLLAVTVLTSLSPGELKELGWGEEGSDLEKRVLSFGQMAMEAGIPGIVSSLKETPALRKALGPAAILVCPGLRPAGAARDDQSRSATPAEAGRSEANYLVVGRPVLQSSDPAATIRELREALVLFSAQANPGG